MPPKPARSDLTGAQNGHTKLAITSGSSSPVHRCCTHSLLWCTMWIDSHIGIHSGEDDPDDHRRAAPEACRQAEPGSKDDPIGVHSRRTRGGDPATANSRGREAS